MEPQRVGESIILFGILVILLSVGGLVTGQAAPIELETASWAGSIVVVVGIVLIIVGN